jgi:hypothetical protein
LGSFLAKEVQSPSFCASFPTVAVVINFDKNWLGYVHFGQNFQDTHLVTLLGRPHIKPEFLHNYT